MVRKQLIVIWILVLLLSGCAMLSRQDKTIKDDPNNVRVSGDAMVSAVDRKGF